MYGQHLSLQRVTLALMSVALVSCGSSASSAPSPTHQLAHFSAPDFGLSFDYPANWRQAAFADDVGSFSALITYLSTEPITDRCSKNGCGPSPPVKQLGSRGVLVSWTARSFLPPPGATIFGTIEGQKTTVDGHPAKVYVGKAGNECPAIGAQEVMHVSIFQTESSMAWTEMIACLRGPDLPDLEREIRSMVASAKLTRTYGGASIAPGT